jgi:hypothetical protein
MARIKVLADGSFEVDNVEDALALQEAVQGKLDAQMRRLFSAATEPTRDVPKTNGSGPVKLTAGSGDVVAALRQLGRERESTEAFAQRLACNPKQLPPKLMQLRRELSLAGIKPEDVVVREKAYEKGRLKSYYRAGKRLDEVLKPTSNLFE